MRAKRYLTLGPENEPLWVRLYVHQIDETWAAMIVRMMKPRLSRVL
jgi:hypothetical protein